MNLLDLARSALVNRPSGDPPRRNATSAEAAELRALVRVVLADALGEWDEVHRIACAGPGAALTCYRELAAPDGPPLGPAAEAHRQRVLRLLEANPGLRIAVATDIAADPEAVVLTVGIRGAATGEIRIPSANYDPLKLMRLMDEYAECGA